MSKRIKWQQNIGYILIYISKAVNSLLFEGTWSKINQSNDVHKIQTINDEETAANGKENWQQVGQVAIVGKNSN